MTAWTRSVADSAGITESLKVTRHTYRPGDPVGIVDPMRVTGNRYQPGDSVGLSDRPPVVGKAGSDRVVPGTVGITDAGRAVRTVESTSSPVTIRDDQIVVKIFASTGVGRPKVNLGSGWQSKPAKVYIGGQWVEKPMKRHNGSTWVPVS